MNSETAPKEKSPPGLCLWAEKSAVKQCIICRNAAERFCFVFVFVFVWFRFVLFCFAQQKQNPLKKHFVAAAKVTKKPTECPPPPSPPVNTARDSSKETLR